MEGDKETLEVVIQKQMEKLAIEKAFGKLKTRVKDEPQEVAKDLLAVVDVPRQFWKEDDKHYKAVAADLLFKHIDFLFDYLIIQADLTQDDKC